MELRPTRDEMKWLGKKLQERWQRGPFACEHAENPGWCECKNKLAQIKRWQKAFSLDDFQLDELRQVIELGHINFGHTLTQEQYNKIQYVAGYEF